MTREEAKRTFEDLRGYKIILSDLSANEQQELWDMAISALSTEEEYIKKEDALKAVSDMAYENSVTIRELLTELPTYTFPNSAENKGDLISREWLLKQPLDTSNYPSNYVKLAPPVENTGEWISTEDRPDGFCSKCDRDIAEVSTPYCPYCGAKMTWVGAIREPYKKGE